MTQPPPPFSIAVEDDGVTVTLHLAGDLDIATAPELREALEPLAAGRRAVVIDLGGLEFVDSSGLSELWRAHLNASQDGWSVRFASPSDEVARTLELAGMLDRLPFVG